MLQQAICVKVRKGYKTLKQKEVKQIGSALMASNIGLYEERI